MKAYRAQQQWISSGYVSLHAALGMGENSKSKKLSVNLTQLNQLKDGGLDVKTYLNQTRKHGALGSTATTATGVLFVLGTQVDKALAILSIKR